MSKLVYMVYYPNGDHTQISKDSIDSYLKQGLKVIEVNTDVQIGISSMTGKPIYTATERELKP